jgi:hypothetical protein
MWARSAIFFASAKPLHFCTSGMIMSTAFFSNSLRKPQTHIDVLAAADGCVRRLQHVAHGVDVLRWNRLFQPHQLERLHFFGEVLGGRQVVARVHVHRQLNVLRQRLAHERDLVDHVIDLGIVRVQFTRSKRAGSRASSTSILAMVQPSSTILAMKGLEFGSSLLSTAESI